MKEIDIPMIDIELVRGCNLHCNFCTVDHIKRLQFMEVALLESILVECRKYRIGYRRLSLFLGGEPLLHPKFPRILEILRQQDLLSRGFSLVQLFTNGTVKPEWYEFMVNSGAITLVRFSIDGCGDASTFEYMRAPAKWDTVLLNLKKMVDLRNKYRSDMSVRVTSLIPYGKFVPFSVPPYEEAKRRMDAALLPLGVDSIGYRKVGTLVGYQMDLPYDYYDHKRTCLLVKDRKIVVNFDGTVSTCSNDLNCNQPLSHISEGGLIGAWQSSRFQTFLQAKIAGEKIPLGYCQECDLNYI